MILAQLILYRRGKGIAVHVVVLRSHPGVGYFSLIAYRGRLMNYAAKGLDGLTKSKAQHHVGRDSALIAFDEQVNRTIHKWHYTCSVDGVYRPTEDAPLAVDIMRAMRIARSQSRARRSTVIPNPILTRKRRLLEFSHP